MDCKYSLGTPKRLEDGAFECEGHVLNSETGNLVEVVYGRGKTSHEATHDLLGKIKRKYVLAVPED